MMNTVRKTMTALEIFNAIENLTDSEKETLAILADEKLSEELMKRRRDALIEMRKGELISHVGRVEERNPTFIDLRALNRNVNRMKENSLHGMT